MSKNDNRLYAKTVAVRVTPELFERFKLAALKAGTTPPEVLRQFIREWTESQLK